MMSQQLCWLATCCPTCTDRHEHGVNGHVPPQVFAPVRRCQPALVPHSSLCNLAQTSQRRVQPFVPGTSLFLLSCLLAHAACY